MPTSSTNILGCNIHLTSPFLKFNTKIFYANFIDMFSYLPMHLSLIYFSDYLLTFITECEDELNFVTRHGMVSYTLQWLAKFVLVPNTAHRTFHNMYFEKSLLLPVHLHGGHICASERRKLRIVSHLISTPTNAYYLLPYSIVQSPFWEANWSAASQETPRISRNP